MSAAETTAGTSPARAGWVTWAGLAVVLTAAAVLSFAALRDLAITVRISERLAWLLPIAVDAGAAVSCAAWLSPRSGPDVARFARRLTWALLALTVAGNAAAQGMAAAGIVPPWWCAVLVGAIPPAVVGGVVHLAVLVGRAPAGDPFVSPATVAELVASRDDDLTDVQVDMLDDHGLSRLWDTASTASPAGDDRVAELIAEGVGRRRLARELGVSEHQARELLEARRNTSAVTS